MDLNNNFQNQLKESKNSLKSVNISFTNELDVDMKVIVKQLNLVY